MNLEDNELSLWRWLGLGAALVCNGSSAILSLSFLALAFVPSSSVGIGMIAPLALVGAVVLWLAGLGAYYLVGGPDRRVAGAHRVIDAMAYWSAGAAAIGLLGLVGVGVVLMMLGS